MRLRRTVCATSEADVGGLRRPRSIFALLMRSLLIPVCVISAAAQARSGTPVLRAADPFFESVRQQAITASRARILHSARTACGHRCLGWELTRHLAVMTSAAANVPSCRRRVRNRKPVQRSVRKGVHLPRHILLGFGGFFRLASSRSGHIRRLQVGLRCRLIDRGLRTDLLGVR